MRYFYCFHSNVYELADCVCLLCLSYFRWLREDSSNMAVIDVKLVSGYQVDEDSLDRVSYYGQRNSCESNHQYFHRQK